MRNAIAADQRIQEIDTKTANQLRKWYQFKSDHDLLTPEERRLAGQIGLEELRVEMDQILEGDYLEAMDIGMEKLAIVCGT